MLSLGTAEGPPGAARLKICVRTLLLYFSASRTNAGCLQFFGTRELILDEGVYSTPRFCTFPDFSAKNILTKIYDVSGNFA